MSRVVNLNSPGKHRNQLMRSGAEVLRRLSLKTSLDSEAKDMTAYLVFCFRAIDEGIDEAVTAWEKRDYWVKAERFRSKWSWTRQASYSLETIIRTEAWDQLAPTLIRLLPYFEEIKISRFTRDADLWAGAHDRLLRGEAPAEL